MYRPSARRLEKAGLAEDLVPRLVRLPFIGAFQFDIIVVLEAVREDPQKLLPRSQRSFRQCRCMAIQMPLSSPAFDGTLCFQRRIGP